MTSETNEGFKIIVQFFVKYKNLLLKVCLRNLIVKSSIRIYGKKKASIVGYIIFKFQKFEVS